MNTNTIEGTALFHRTIEFDYGDQRRNDLMRKVWEPTPWMIDARTGSPGDALEREVLDWCRETFGPQASPIHGRPGRWQRGSATIYGWTWFGFAAREEMAQFTTRWECEKET